MLRVETVTHCCLFDQADNLTIDTPVVKHCGLLYSCVHLIWNIFDGYARHNNLSLMLSFIMVL